MEIANRGTQELTIDGNCPPHMGHSMSSLILHTDNYGEGLHENVFLSLLSSPLLQLSILLLPPLHLSLSPPPLIHLSPCIENGPELQTGGSGRGWSRQIW